jgi:hypothetical protein
MRAYWHSGWRRVLSCLLAYALALQGFIFAFDASRPAVAAAPDAVWAGFELCSHSDAGAALPDAPQAPASHSHCVFCLAGIVYVNSAPPVTPHCGAVVAPTTAWTLVAPELVAFQVNRNAWPRGPPSAL